MVLLVYTSRAGLARLGRAQREGRWASRGRRHLAPRALRRLAAVLKAAKATSLKDRQKAKKRKILAAMIDLEHAPSYCLFDSKWPLPFRKKGLFIIYVFGFFLFYGFFGGCFHLGNMYVLPILNSGL